MLLREGAIQGFDRSSRGLHPGRLTWNLKMMVWKMIFLFNWVIIRFLVNLPGCNNSLRGHKQKTLTY